MIHFKSHESHLKKRKTKPVPQATQPMDTSVALSVVCQPCEPVPVPQLPWPRPTSCPLSPSLPDTLLQKLLHALIATARLPCRCAAWFSRGLPPAIPTEHHLGAFAIVSNYCNSCIKVFIKSLSKAPLAAPEKAEPTQTASVGHSHEPLSPSPGSIFRFLSLYPQSSPSPCLALSSPSLCLSYVSWGHHPGAGESLPFPACALPGNVSLRSETTLPSPEGLWKRF